MQALTHFTPSNSVFHGVNYLLVKHPIDNETLQRQWADNFKQLVGRKRPSLQSHSADRRNNATRTNQLFNWLAFATVKPLGTPGSFWKAWAAQQSIANRDRK
jgi:hypothetical protein